MTQVKETVQAWSDRFGVDWDRQTQREREQAEIRNRGWVWWGGGLGGMEGDGQMLQAAETYAILVRRAHVGPHVARPGPAGGRHVVSRCAPPVGWRVLHHVHVTCGEEEEERLRAETPLSIKQLYLPNFSCFCFCLTFYQPDFFCFCFCF